MFKYATLFVLFLSWNVEQRRCRVNSVFTLAALFALKYLMGSRPRVSHDFFFAEKLTFEVTQWGLFFFLFGLIRMTTCVGPTLEQLNSFL